MKPNHIPIRGIMAAVSASAAMLHGQARACDPADLFGTSCPPMGITSTGVALGDMNGDGAVDLVGTLFSTLPGLPQGIVVQTGNGDGGFQCQGLACIMNFGGSDIPYDPELADLDADGDLDVVASLIKGEIVLGIDVFLNDGHGTLTLDRLYTTPEDRPRGTELADLDGDGDIDIAVVLDSDTGIGVMLNDGSGAFAPFVPYTTTGILGDDPVLADLDGDGDADLFVADSLRQQGLVMFNDGDAGFSAGQPIALDGQSPCCPAVGDLDSDGDTDLIIPDLATDADAVSVLLNNSDGTFRPETRYPVGVRARQAELADFDGDGKPDVIVANSGSEDLSLLIGNGDGTLQAEHRLDVLCAGNPIYLASGDLNADRAPELAVGTVNGGLSSSFSVLLNQCGPFNQCPADLAEPFGLLDLADITAFVQAFMAQGPAADFDGNGLFDLDDVVAFGTAFAGGCR